MSRMKAMCLNEKAEFVWQDVPDQRVIARST